MYICIGLQFPTAVLTGGSYGIKDELETIHHSQQSSKRKRDEVTTDSADELPHNIKKKAKSKHRSRGGVEKYSACQAEMRAENKKHKHKDKVTSGKVSLLHVSEE
jgi:hypothetical protein